MTQQLVHLFLKSHFTVLEQKIRCLFKKSINTLSFCLLSFSWPAPSYYSIIRDSNSRLTIGVFLSGIYRKDKYKNTKYQWFWIDKTDWKKWWHLWPRYPTRSEILYCCPTILYVQDRCPVTSLFLKRSAYYHDERGCSLDAYSHRRCTECYSFKKNMSVRDKGVTAEIYQPEKDYRKKKLLLLPLHFDSNN